VKFLISVIDDLSGSGTSEEMVAIDAFNDELRANGHWIFAWAYMRLLRQQLLIIEMMQTSPLRLRSSIRWRTSVECGSLKLQVWKLPES